MSLGSMFLRMALANRGGRIMPVITNELTVEETKLVEDEIVRIIRTHVAQWISDIDELGSVPADFNFWKVWGGHGYRAVKSTWTMGCLYGDTLEALLGEIETYEKPRVWGQSVD